MISDAVSIGDPHAHSSCHVHPYATDLTVTMDCTLLNQAGHPAGFLNADEDATFKVVVKLEGGLRHHLCGELCVCVHIECIGPGDPVPLPCERQELDPCDEDGEYTFEIKIPAGTVSAGPEHCGQVCCFAATLTSFTLCGDQGHIACFCKGPCVMVHKEPVENGK